MATVPRRVYRPIRFKYSPCFGCEERTVGCHGICERYKAYNEDQIADIQKRRRAYTGEFVTEDVLAKTAVKINRKRGKK